MSNWLGRLKKMNKNNNLTKTNKGAMPIGFALIFAIVLAILLLHVRFPNSDTFFIIETGKYIVENKVVPAINPFVIHDGLEIIVQQWLFDVLIYWIYNLFGWVGIMAYSIIVLFISIFAMYKFLSMYSRNVLTKTIILSAYCVFAKNFVVARPTSVSFIMCLLLVMTMENYRRNRKPMILCALPLISLATVNFHASMWPMLFVLMLPFVAPTKLPQSFQLSELKSYAKEWFKTNRWIFVAMISMLLLGFINPSGINGMSYVIRSYGSATTENIIAELQAPTIFSAIGVFIVVSIMGLLLYIMKYQTNVNVPLVYMTMGTLVLAIAHARNIWFLFFGGFPICAILFDSVPINHAESNRQAKDPIFNAFGAITILLASILTLSACPQNVQDGILSPTMAADYLDNKDSSDVILYTGFNNGAYMELRGYKVYLDARPELFQKNINKKEDIYSEYINVRNGKINYQEFVNKYQFTHVLVEDNDVFGGFMRACADYKLVVDGDGYCLYERN